MNDQESFRALQLMNELEAGESVSQRELAGRLGVAVGLVNSYLKNFVAKGFLRVKNYPRNRYAYLLTPKGLAEKSRLAYQHLHYFNNLYTVVRQDYLTLFRHLKENGTDEVVFCGVDEVAEIAYLSLREAGMGLVGVVDDSCLDKTFFGHNVTSMIWLADYEITPPVVLTSLKRSVDLFQGLIQAGIAAEKVFAPAEYRY